MSKTELTRCAACGHVSSSDNSMYPREDTPAEKIRVVISSRLASYYCSNPNCQCYTIHAPSSSAFDSLTAKYKSRKP